MMQAEYAAGITWVDSQIARLFEGLRSRGIYDEALIVLTSDHGEVLFDHALGGYWATA